MIAEEARSSLGLSEVLLVPSGQPVFKTHRPVTPAEHRLQMLRLASAGRPSFRVSDMEVTRPGPSYTVDTIAELRDRYGDGGEIYFILGWDMLGRLPGWREPARLVEMCFLVAAPRPGCPRPDPQLLEASIPGITGRVVFLEKPHVDISASAIRERAARGLSLRRLVPAPVAEYIKQHKLYSNR
jgi:nicotinate-nucleotide adenylyltransferase